MYLSACRCGGRGLGDLTSSVISQLCPQGVGKAPCQTVSVSAFTSFLDQAISSRFLPAYTSATGASSNCSQFSGGASASISQGLNITRAAGGAAAATAVAAGAAAGSVVPVVGTIVGVISGILANIFGHHAQAVEMQDEILCQAVPQTNSMLQQIDQMLASGQMQPADASTAYQTIYSQFAAGVGSDPSFKTGDAMYGYLLALQAVIAARQQDLQNGVLTGGQTAPWAQPPAAAAGSAPGAPGASGAPGATPLASSGTSLLPWLLVGGAALLLLS